MPIAVTAVVKDTFWQCVKYKILLKIVFEILLSNTFDFTQKIQNTFVIYLKYKIRLCISNTYLKYLYFK